MAQEMITEMTPVIAYFSGPRTLRMDRGSLTANPVHHETATAIAPLPPGWKDQVRKPVCRRDESKNRRPAMSDLYKRANAGRLAFKGGDLAAVKSIDKKKKKKKHKPEEQQQQQEVDEQEGVEGGGEGASAAAAAGGEPVYTIDAAKKMKYEELFPVESRKFGYDPANKARSTSKSVGEALDDRVKKKADRYCK